MTEAATRCAFCGRENRPDLHFCTECGTLLCATCPSCGLQAQAGDQFCGQCGARLASDAAALKPAGRETVETPGTGAGERRQLTVMFCDLVGSTTIAAQLDPEEWRDVAARYQRSTAEAVTRFGGHVAKYLGDGLVVFFGWPQAHEDDAQRAVRAGLAIVAAVQGLNAAGTAQHATPLRVRVGIHTGPVVVGHGGGDAADVFGGTPNIAARVQSVAPPDAVLITAATQRLAAGQFVVDEPRVEHLKGVGEPVVLYRVRQPAGMRGRLAAMAVRGLTPFVGREQERRLLMERWEQAQEGAGQVVLIMGEPGIGKSRLVQQFKADLGGVPHSWFETAGSPYHADSPLYLVREGILKQVFAWAGNTPAALRLDILAEAVAAAGLEVEAVPLLAPLLDLAVPPGRYPPLLLAPEQQRRRLLATLVQWTLAGARLQPNIFAIEDVQWADPSTLEALGLLAEQCASASILLIITARPGFLRPWPLRAHHTELTLNRLTEKQVRQMIANVTARMVPTQDVVEALMARADGVPLFVEELTRAVVEGAAGGVATSEVPATLQDSLMARLDRLGPAKEVAQIASVIGREFPYALLRDVVGARDAVLLPQDDLNLALQKLIVAGLVYARGLPPDATYTFKHALIQETAYASLLKSRRRQLHRLVATVLTESFAPIAETQPEVAAQHWQAAGEAERAVAAWQQAGDRARDREAHVEAERYYTRAIEVLGTLPDTPARAQQELMLRLPLGQMVGITRGYLSPDMLRCQARARELSEQLGDTQQIVTILLLAFASTFTRGETRAALAVADQLLDAAERDGSTFALTYAHYLQGIARYMLGELANAREHAERALSVYREEDHRGWPGEPGVLSQGLLAYGLAQLGFVDQAYAKIRELVATVPRLESPTHRAFAYEQVIAALGYLRDADGIMEHTESLRRLTAEQQIPAFETVGRSQRGWALAMLGRPEEGIAELRSGIEGSVARQRVALGLCLGYLAEAQLVAGRITDGLVTIEQAVAAVPEERLHIPELQRLRGELLLKTVEPTQSTAGRETEEAAERCFRDGIAGAHEMGAKLTELRVTTSLGHLLNAQGRAAEARDLLAPLYASFTEGFAARDLVEAKALLEEL